MRIDRATYEKMPAHLKALFAKLPNPGSEEVLARFPDRDGAVSNGKNGVNEIYGDGWGKQPQMPGYADSGSAARFFYCAKASKSDRGDGNTHPTVKPLALMEYLVKLVKMPGDNHFLDPFAGSGTTLLACYNNFCKATGIDLEDGHSEIAEERAGREAKKTPLFP